MRKKRKSPTIGLTKRMEAFARIFAADLDSNGTGAARQAGFKGNDGVLAATAVRLLRNDKVGKLIQELRGRNIRALENRIIGSREILIRMTRIALTTITDILEPDGSFNATKAEARGVALAIKRIRFHDNGRVSDIELYDAQKALTTLGDYYGLWKRGWLLDEEDPDAVICKILGISPEQLNRIKPAGLLTEGSSKDYDYEVTDQGEAVPVEAKEN